LSSPHDTQRAFGRSRCWRQIGALILGAILCSGSIALADPSPASAATGLKVAIILGPAGSQTIANKAWADAAAREALRYTTNVVRVYTPNATWTKVKAAMTGASIVVYVGRGSGFPSVSGSVLKPATHNGFGLNPVAGRGSSTTRYYGEAYIRTVTLAPKAVVLLHRTDYASGRSPSGYAQPSLSLARRRVDNYGAGFLAAGASAVIAEYSASPTYYVRAIFTQSASLGSLWNSAPAYHGHVTAFSSTRTRGATGRTDPISSTSNYTRSIVGWPTTRTTTIRQEPVSCGSSLQAKVDAAPSGGTLNLTGCTYAAGATIGKPLTIIGARVAVPAGQRGFIVTASNVTLDSVVVTGPQASTYSWNEVGILTTGSISNLVVRNATIRSFGNAGIWVGPSTNSRITGTTIEDAVYAGIMVISAAGGRVDGNVVRRIGVIGSSTKGGNAYGIAVSNEGGAVSTDVVVDGNTVETVPTWHGLDTHAGVRISFTNNTVSGAPRALFITSDSYGRKAADITVTGNRFLSPAPATDRKAVTTYAAVGVTVTGNTASGWGDGNFFHDYQGQSTGLVVSGNTVTP
jgi:hypothetical protein